MMLEAVSSPYLVSFKGKFSTKKASTVPPKGSPGKKKSKALLAETVEELAELQRVLYAHDQYAVLLVFQAMDAAGKDSTIRAVMSGVNPAGCHVSSFKKPSSEEIDHDFLWRTARRLPERGRIGIFNRSYYEEVLVVRVHPKILDYQRLPERPAERKIWRQRYESIEDHEKHLARNGTVIMKFWLNVSKQEQCARFLSRLNEPEKNWKFAAGDVTERGHWDAYQKAYEDALNATSRPWAPWYAIPADDKPFMRLTVARLVAERLASLDLAYPEVGDEQRTQFDAMRQQLEKEQG